MFRADTCPGDRLQLYIPVGMNAAKPVHDLPSRCVARGHSDLGIRLS